MKRFHSCTSLFTQNIYENMVLTNNCWSHVNHIQAAGLKHQIPSNMYIDFGQTFNYKLKHFMGAHEENIPSNFVPLIKQGVKIEPYDLKNINHNPVYFPQANPDVSFVFKDSTFIDKRTHALDQKTNNPGLGKSKILSEITIQRYHSTIDRFQKELSLTPDFNLNIVTALKELKETCTNLEEHQQVWAKYLHLFPNNFIPPLKIPQNFSYSQFKPEILKEIKKAESRVQKISDLLYEKKIPQISHGIFPQEALDFFNDSQMQKILNGDLIDF